MTHNSGMATDSHPGDTKAVLNERNTDSADVMPERRWNALLALIQRKNLTLGKADLRQLGADLKAAMGEKRPYAPSYLHSVATGRFPISKPMMKAIMFLNKYLNGEDIVLMASETFNIQAPPGWNGDGAYCPIAAKICNDPKKKGCINHFIPNIHNRNACYTCTPIGKG